MKKKEFVKRYGEAAYEKTLSRTRKWQLANPKKVEARNHEMNRKGGKRYEKKLEYMRTGLGGEKARVRWGHARMYRQFKKVIAPASQLHHQWRPGSAEYDGVALVEKDQHMRGFINVILILDGVITLATETEVRER